MATEQQRVSSAAPWWAAASIYQIYPRSFSDSNRDGIGDLEGVISRLDYLAGLGVDAIWLSPFFTSPQRDVGYDVADYRDVAPEYGTVEIAQRLIDEAHDRGLKVLFDLVLNHTSDQHPWFVESRSSRDNDKADWYIWADPKVGRGGRPKAPNNWRSELQIESAWRWSPEREQYFLASFLDFQPDLNWRNPQVRDEMFDMVRMWLGRGVDGFRLDIFGSIMNDPQLRDNPRRPEFVGGLPRLQTPKYTLNTDDNFVLAGELRAVCDEFGPGERVLLGEVFGSEATLARYVNDGGVDGLHVVFLFEWLAAKYGARKYRSLIEKFEAQFPAPMQPTYVVENHDRTRSMSRLGGDPRKARVLATLMLTLRGIPVLYQGQEIGMTNRYIPLADAIDPIPGLFRKYLPEAVNQRIPERLNRDEVRIPMQWEPGPGHGFTTSDATPWLPFGTDADTVTVETQTGNDDSLLELYRTLLEFRRSSAAVTNGSLRLLESHADVIAFERRDGDDAVIVVANLGDVGVAHRVPDGTEVVISTDAANTVRDDVAQVRWVSLAPHAAVVLDAAVARRRPTS